jgi:uncharacterized membrane protein YbaN (DUF454 family)
MKLKNLLLTALGFVLLGFGAIGLFLPVLPTTPLVLFASACFAGNPRMRGRLLRNAFFREHFRNYQNRTGLKKRTVAFSLGFLWGMLGLSLLLVQELWYALLLAAVGIAVSLHILCIAKPSEKSGQGICSGITRLYRKKEKKQWKNTERYTRWLPAPPHRTARASSSRACWAAPQ